MGAAKEIIGIPYDHIHTTKKINDSIICKSCPYKIYSNKTDTVTMGIGNIFSNFIFVVPTYDSKSKVGNETTLTKLISIYHEITGKELLEQIYVTRLVKCYKTVDHNLYNQSVTPCSNYLMYEFGRLQGKHVIMFGTTYSDYISNCDVVGLNIPNKIIHKCYSPDVLFYDNDTIKQRFIDTLSNILNNN